MDSVVQFYIAPAIARPEIGKPATDYTAARYRHPGGENVLPPTFLYL